MSVYSSFIASSPKNSLDRSIPINVADIVTTNDTERVIKAYAVKEIDEDNIATICSIELTESHDTYFIKETKKHASELLYLGISFVSVNGLLYTLRYKIEKGLY